MLESLIEELATTTVVPTNQLQEAKNRMASLSADNADPLLLPLIEAAAQLRQKLDAIHKQKIEDFKRESAEQTKNIYARLTESQNQLDSLQDAYQAKMEEVENTTRENIQLQEQLNQASEITKKYQQEMLEHSTRLHEIEEKYQEEITAINNKNETLIEKLKNKIDQIYADYTQQVTHLEQKLEYQKQQMTTEIISAQNEANDINIKLNDLKNEYAHWQQEREQIQEKMGLLESDNLQIQHVLKEKSEKLLRYEHNLKLAHEELERNQQYIKDLEEKNNTIQKELFENWIQKEAF